MARLFSLNSCHVSELYYSQPSHIWLFSYENSIMKTTFTFERRCPLTNDDLSPCSYCFFLPSTHSTLSLSLSAHLNNYYNPEECKLRGTNNGGKGKTLKNSFAFSSPRHPNIYSLIPSIISWFKQQTIITLPLHCSNAMNTFELIQMLQVSKPTRRFSSYFPEFPKKSDYNDCCGEN